MTGQELPTGTLTFLFTDIEGSTRLADALGMEAYARHLDRHRTLLRDAFDAHGGIEVSTEGDSFFVVFERPSDAAAAAADGQRALASEPWPPDWAIRVRMGLHTGQAMVTDGTYVGHHVNRAARVAAAGHGGQILVSETTAPLISAGLPAGTSLASLGLHRLKDLRPEQICQLDVDGLPTEFAPIRSLDHGSTNLPTQLTSFVGREAEVAAVAALVERARLVTLTGPGGTGKTRLSLQVAAGVADRFVDGVRWVPLAEIREPGLVASEMATALGLPEAGGRPTRDRLADHLRDRDALLVLDNFEQVVAAAPLLADLLREAPRVRMLVSSRIVLRVSGEHEYPVPPLRLPPADQAGLGSTDPAVIGESDAVRLFVERAVAARPGFVLDAGNARTVAAIVARLDGLPLAIELAAARARLLPPDAMLARLERRLDMLASGARDLPARQQTLRAAIAWSFDLLEPPLRRLFARFSVFVGGATLDGAEAVCGPAAELGIDVLDGLETLVEHSLVRQDESEGEPRFSMLATIREFAAERLADSGEEAEIRARHAHVFLALAEDAAPHLTGPESAGWLDRVDREHDNIRGALTWAADGGDRLVGLRLVTALWRFAQIRGHLFEGRERTVRAVSLTPPDAPAELRAAAYEAAGGLDYWLGDFGSAARWYEAQLAARRELGDPAGIAQALYNLAFPLTFGRIDLERASEAAHEAEVAFRSLGDRSGLARSLWLLANLATQTGDAAVAREYCLEAEPIFRALGETFMLGWCLFTLAQTLILDDRDGEARDRIFEALDRFDSAGDVSGLVLVLDALAYLELRTGDRQRAARISGAVERLEATTGTALNVNNRRVLKFLPRVLRDNPETADAWQAGRRDSNDEILAFVRERQPGATPAA